MVKKSHVFGLVAFLSSSFAVTSANAQSYDVFKRDLGRSIENFVGFTGLSLIADVTFTIHDGYLLSNGRRQSTGWAVAETALTLPQVGFLNYSLIGAFARGSDEDVRMMSALAVVPSVWTTQLATHGIWSLASDRTPLNDCGRFVRNEREEGAKQGQDERHHRNAQDPFVGGISSCQQNEANYGAIVEHIAMPKKNGVQHAQNEQNEEPPQIHTRNGFSRNLARCI